MVQAWKEIGPQRYRESFGRYFEDFHVGDVYEHRPGKTVLESDNHLFTLLTLNTHPLHFDAEYAKASEFGRNLVVSTYTLALLIGMSVTDCSQKAIANLGMDEVRFSGPVFAGDTLYAESEVLSKRESRSRPGQGLGREARPVQFDARAAGPPVVVGGRGAAPAHMPHGLDDESHQ